MKYNTTKVTDEVTLEKILKKTNEFSIFKYYIPELEKLNKAISSPLRTDRNPSWSLFESSSSEIMYKDFATGESGNIIKFVQRKFEDVNNYPQALNKIWDDIIANNKFKTINAKDYSNGNDKVHISIKRKYFTKNDIEYWEQFSISKKTLKFFDVYPIEAYWVNDKKGNLIYTKEQPMYAYKLFNKFKIYRPYSKSREDKWRTNCGYYDIQGIKQLPKQSDLLIITKSLKDIMSLYELGYNAIAPQSEQSVIPVSIMKNLQDRFKRIVVLYDNDEGGKTGAKKLNNKYNIKTLFIPQHYIELYRIKDISDCIKEMGMNKTKEILRKLILI